MVTLAASRRRPQLHVSASSLRTLAECPREFYFKYIRGYPREDLPARMLLGTAVHKALAAFYECLRDGHQAPGLDMLVQLAGTSIASAIVGDTPIRYDDDQGPADLVQEAERVLAAFLAAPFLPHKILGVEMNVGVTLGHPITGEVPYEESLTAVFDLVVEDADGIVTVIDHKVTGRFAPPKDSRSDLQMGLYAFAATQVFRPDQPVKLQHHVLARTKAVRIELANIPRGKDDAVEAVEAAFSGLELIRTAVAHPDPLRLLGRHRSWKCGSCSYRSRCAQPAGQP